MVLVVAAWLWSLYLIVGSLSLTTIAHLDVPLDPNDVVMTAAGLPSMQAEGGGGGSSDVTLRIQFTDLDIQAALVRARISAHVSLEFAKTLTDYSGEPLLNFDTLTFQGSEPNLVISVGSGEDYEIPLARILKPFSPETDRSVVITLAADALSSYPGDVYEFADFIEVSLDLPGNARGPLLSNVVAVAEKEAGLRDYDLTVSDYDSSEYVGAFIPIGGHVRRQWDDKTFVWMMALSPLLLIIILAHQTLGRDRSFLPLDAAAALLALLPLRAVLVPGEVRGFTQLDSVLGAMTVTVLAIVTVGYAIHVRGQGQRTHAGLAQGIKP